MKEPLVRAANRAALVDAVNSYILASADALSPDEPYLKLEMAECGSIVKYWSEEEVPETSVPCPCGDPEHWMILYEEPERP